MGNTPISFCNCEKSEVEINLRRSRRNSKQAFIAEIQKGKMSSEIKDQLHVYHNPFAAHTSQPKIPDGKCTHSLGFSTQAVFELGNSETDSLLEIILYPGQNSAFICSGTPTQAQSGLNRNYWIPAFNQSGNIDWSGATSPATTYEIGSTDGYAKWRLVSCGMQLKLLNSVEEDDGWWECIRLNENVDTDKWALTTTENSSDRANDGTLAQYSFIDLTNRNITNEASYSTGLLRDLNRVQFELHPTVNDHDFVIMNDEVHQAGGDYAYIPATEESIFSRGSAENQGLIKTFNDFNYDMIYLRLHCRPRTATINGSRFHVNVVSNQEIIYDSSDRLSRYHTKSHNIGTHAEVHADMRRRNGAAANLVS